MNVLILADSSTISTVVTQTLTSYGYNTNNVNSKDFSVALLENMPTDLVIIDTRLDSKDSISLCKSLREKKPKIYIMGINSKGSWEDKIEILNNGADDCLTYPFPTKEILARIQALLRRPRVETSTSLKYGNIRLNPAKRRAKYKDSRLKLTKKEFCLLEYLLRNKERTVTRSELMDHVWDYRRITGSNTVDVHVQKLRKKMRSCVENSDETSDNGADRYLKRGNFNFPTEIKTVHGVGYKLDKIGMVKDKRVIPELK
ncbi:response regulator transcription factor [Candidatus Dojkabacteria bacterium]|nr:response regulator transcription factor [Candidatus Dojkabacteria bacterium]